MEVPVSHCPNLCPNLALMSPNLCPNLALIMQAGRPVEVPVYDFTTHSRSDKTQYVEPADVVVVEGILVLHMQRIRWEVSTEAGDKVGSFNGCRATYLCIAWAIHLCTNDEVTRLSHLSIPHFTSPHTLQGSFESESTCVCGHG